MVELKPGTIVYYNDTYWRIVRVGRYKGEVEFYECRLWCDLAAIIVPAKKIRVPGRLELLVTLGVKANG